MIADKLLVNSLFMILVISVIGKHVLKFVVPSLACDDCVYLVLNVLKLN